MSSSMADCDSPLVRPLILEVEEVLVSLEVDSFSLCKVRALELIRLCCMMSFCLAFTKMSDSSGSELSDDMTVFTILATSLSLNTAMVPVRKAGLQKVKGVGTAKQAS